jgi:hypothetical protein
MTATSTFSQSITGYLVGQIEGGGTPANNVLVPDASVDTIALATQGGQAYAVQIGSPVLAKGPDGAFHWYRIRHPGGPNAGGTTTHPSLEYMGP